MDGATPLPVRTPWAMDGGGAGGWEEPGEPWNTDASCIFSVPHHARLLGHFVSFLVTKNCQLFGWFFGKLLFHRKKNMKNGSICRTNVFLEGLRFRVVFINHHEEFSVCDNAMSFHFISCDW